jgi:hypothetical protein
MGTRSTTKVVTEYGPVVNMYRQYDGYLEGHGQELAEFLVQFSLVNGLGNGNPEGRVANGLGCLAAQMVAEFKTEAGGIYLMAMNQTEEYNYEITLGQSGLNIKVTKYSDEVVFNGSPEDLLRVVAEKTQTF